MTPAPTNPRWQFGLRRGVRVLIWGLLLLPIVVFCGSNLWLQSTWGRSWLEKIIQQKTSCYVRIGGAGWLPGGQIWLDDLRVIIPAADGVSGETTVLQIRCVSMRPAWRSWLRGSRKISEIVISHPRLDVPLDVLQRMLPAPVVVPQPDPSVAAQATSGSPQDAAVATAASPAPIPAPAPQITEAPSPTVWLKVEHGSVVIRKSSPGDVLCEAQDIESNLPVGGAPAVGYVACGAMIAMGQPVAPLGRVDVRWNFPLWESEETSLQALGLRARGKMQIARLAGFPFAALMAQDPQTWDAPGGMAHVEHLQSLHQCTGLLLAPVSWRGESVLETHASRANLGSQQLQGFLSQARFQLQGGLLRCVEFRWLGDDYGFVGNGLFSLRGEVLAQIRLMTTRATAQSWQSRWITSSMGPTPVFQPLFNEDRQAIDVFCGGHIAQPWISFDQGRSLLDAFQWQKAFRSLPSPNHP